MRPRLTAWMPVAGEHGRATGEPRAKARPIVLETRTGATSLKQSPFRIRWRSRVLPQARQWRPEVTWACTMIIQDLAKPNMSRLIWQSDSSNLSREPKSPSAARGMAQAAPTTNPSDVIRSGSFASAFYPQNRVIISLPSLTTMRPTSARLAPITLLTGHHRPTRGIICLRTKFSENNRGGARCSTCLKSTATNVVYLA